MIHPTMVLPRVHRQDLGWIFKFVLEKGLVGSRLNLQILVGRGPIDSFKVGMARSLKLVTILEGRTAFDWIPDICFIFLFNRFERAPPKDVNERKSIDKKDSATNGIHEPITNAMKRITTDIHFLHMILTSLPYDRNCSCVILCFDWLVIRRVG